MANRTAKAPETEKQSGDRPDSPRIDSTNQAVKKMLARHVACDEISAALPLHKVSSEQIDTVATLSELGADAPSPRPSARSKRYTAAPAMAPFNTIAR